MAGLYLYLVLQQRQIRSKQLLLQLEKQLAQPSQQALIQSEQAAKQIARQPKIHPQIPPIHLIQSSHSSTIAHTQNGQQITKKTTVAMVTFPFFFVP